MFSHYKPTSKSIVSTNIIEKGQKNGHSEKKTVVNYIITSNVLLYRTSGFSGHMQSKALIIFMLQNQMSGQLILSRSIDKR